MKTINFWHLHGDFESVPPIQLIERTLGDDNLNRRRSFATFKDEIELVDHGLALYVQAIQSAFKEREAWADDVRLRASIAMLIHAFNSFLAWKTLLAIGYVAEGRLLARNIYESLCQALAFRDDESLATKFFQNRRIPAKETHRSLSKAFADEQSGETAVLKAFATRYNLLSNRAHPTIDSFALRTNAQIPGMEGLRGAVPEGVLTGGLLSDELGHIVWVRLARDIADGLASVGYVLKDATGSWEQGYQKFRALVENQIAEDESRISEG